MKNSILGLLIFITSCSPKVSDISWLQGTWSRTYNNVEQTEVWKMDGDTLIGKAYFIQNGDSTLNEVMFIHIKDGILTFTAKPSNFDTPKHFKCSDSKSNDVLFENNGNDFPKAIRYFTKEDSLFAVLGGSVNGFDKTTVFGFKRTP